MMRWERVSVTPPSWTYPQPVIQQAAPGGKDSLGLGRQTGRTPPTTSTHLSDCNLILHLREKQ